ncbi:FtsX-like permease family protein [Streptomyces sp. NPDC051940]|uniref:FtsX-like permease family protein n=1 Tax=Streptomyces sp. NPDC051940 TaxID=3155675 RepID=UPI00342FC370
MGGWTRIRLRTAPGAALALGLLVLVTAFLAALLPLAVSSGQDRAVRETVDAAPADDRTLTFSFDRQFDMDPMGENSGLAPLIMENRTRIIRDLTRDPLRTDPAAVSFGVRTAPYWPASDPGLPRPDGKDPLLQLDARAKLADHVRLVSGELPPDERDEGTDAAPPKLRAAITEATARTLKLHVGSVLHLRRKAAFVGGPGMADLPVEITGIVAPKDPRSDFWKVDELLAKPRLGALPAPPGPGPVPSVWKAALLLSPENGPTVFREFGSDLGVTYNTPEPSAYWQLPLSTEQFGARDVDPALEQLEWLQDGPGLAELRGQIQGGLQVTSGLPALFAEYLTLRDAITPVVAVTAFGVATAALVVLVMAGGLAAVRRDAELRLLRARGGSLKAVAARLAAETGTVSIPAAGLGLGVALLMAPDGRLDQALVCAGGVAVVATLALPLRAVAALRTLRAGTRQDLVLAKPSRRRTVVELTLLVVAVGAIAAVRRRGTDTGDVDLLITAAPVLAALIAASLFMRLYPLPMRLAAKPAARRRGAIGFLSLARAGRTHAASALPLLALLVALSTASFGGSVISGVEQARTHAALREIGAEASIDGQGSLLPPAVAQQLKRTPGVRTVASVRIEHGLAVTEAPFSVTLVIADREQYARLSKEVGIGAHSAGRTRAEFADVELHALVSPDIAEALKLSSDPGSDTDPQTFGVEPSFGNLKIKPVGVLDRTPAAPGGSFVLVAADMLANAYPEYAELPDLEPNLLLASGSGVDGGALRKAVQKLAPAAAVDTRTEARARLGRSELQSGAERLYIGGAFAAAGFAVLAVVLSLLQAAPERKALLARLRTMGLGPAHGRRLLVLEALPQLLAGAAVGLALSVVAIRLVGPGLDLGAMATALHRPSDAPVRLHADTVSLLVPSLTVPALAMAAVVFQAWWGWRKRATEELKAGDRE